MLPHLAYQQRQETTPPRIDVILQLYDRMLARLQLARAALEGGEAMTAGTALGQVQMIVTALASGLTADDELSATHLRLYEFVAHQLAVPDAARIADAQRVLTTLRESFEAVRAEALRLEREGAIPSLDRAHTVCTTA